MILDVDGLEFHYKSHPVLKDVYFHLKKGEIISILGRNGAGKTTLLKCLNQILSPQKGSIKIDGNDYKQLKPVEIARKAGWVPQQSERSRIKVYDFVLLGRKPWFRWEPNKRDFDRVEEAISLLGLEDLALRYADELSGGEFQLVQIVRALAQEPRIILFDEPTNSLDISNQHHLMTQIRSLIHGSTKSAVMTMHDINLALRYSDKFLLLNNGRITAAGNSNIITPETIKEVYQMDVHVTKAAGYLMVVPV